MSIFDKLKKTAENLAQSAAGAALSKKETFTFQALPESLAEMQALPEAALTSPFQTAALTVCALCAYGAEEAIGVEMLNWLKGPNPLTPHDLAFLKDRFRDEQYYVPFSYFAGATPENNYEPSKPYTVTIESGPYSDNNPGYMKLFLRSGGADSPREIVLRQTSGGQWMLWEQFLTVGIRKPKAADPWA